MKRGLILGNSHIAALTSAANQNPGRWANFSFDRFGVQGDWMDHFDLVDGVLRTDNPEAAARVKKVMEVEEKDLRGYDFFVITGLHFSIFLALNAFRRHGTLQMPSIDTIEDSIDHDVSLVSDAMMQAVMRDLIENATAFRFAYQLKVMSNAPILMVSQPRPVVGLHEKQEKFRGFKRLLDRGDAQYVSEFFETTAKRVCQDFGLYYMPQLDHMVEEGLFTREDYMFGSTRLGARDDLEHTEDDYLHANAKYGAEVLDLVTSRLTHILPKETETAQIDSNAGFEQIFGWKG